MDAHHGDGVPADDDVARLFEQYSANVFRVCRARTRNIDEAEDAVQETFLRLLTADRSAIDDPQAWLVRVAIRVCARVIQRPRLRRDEHESELNEEQLAEEMPDPEEPAVDSAWLAALAKRMRHADYQVLHWLYVTGLSHEQVAERLGVTVVNVRQMAFRARNRLRELHDMLGIGLDLMLFLNPLMLAHLSDTTPGRPVLSVISGGASCASALMHCHPERCVPLRLAA